eukprot:gene369-6783_t
MVDKFQILRQYRSYLKYSKLFKELGVKKYIQRIVKQDFRKYKNTNQEREIEKLYKSGEEKLEIVKRQGTISSLYQTKPSILESPKL